MKFLLILRSNRYICDREGGGQILQRADIMSGVWGDNNLKICCPGYKYVTYPRRVVESCPGGQKKGENT